MLSRDLCLGMRCASLVFCHATTSSTRRATAGCGAPLPEALPAGSGTPLDARKGWPKSSQYVERHVLRAKGWPKSWQYVEPKRVQVYIYLPYRQRAQVYVCLYRSVKTSLTTPCWRESDSTPQFTNRRIGGVRAASIHSFKPQHLVRIGGLVELRTD